MKLNKKPLVQITIIFTLLFSCKSERSQVEIQHEQLLKQENDIKFKKLEMELEELKKEKEIRSKEVKIIEEKKQFQDKIDNEVTEFINKIFLKWGSNWSIDNYLDESVSIQNFEKNDDKLKIEGKFKFNRIGSIKYGRFEGEILIKEAEMQIKDLCYFYKSESSCL